MPKFVTELDHLKLPTHLNQSFEDLHSAKDNETNECRNYSGSELGKFKAYSNGDIQQSQNINSGSRGRKQGLFSQCAGLCCVHISTECAHPEIHKNFTKR